MSRLYMMAAITNRNMKAQFKEFFEGSGQSVFSARRVGGQPAARRWIISGWKPRKKRYF